MTAILFFMILAAVISAFIAGNALNLRRELNESIQEEQTREITGAVLRTSFGNIEIVFNTPAVGAKDNFIKLVRQHFYDGLRFHRVVKDFAIQTGDPLSRDLSAAAKWGTGGPGYTLPQELSSTDKMLKGSVIMANDNDKSHGSQFMILVADTPWLIEHNTQFATVTKGIEIAETISNLDSGVTGIPAQEVRLLDIQLK
jgi:cyclophilin family peptidyl-prolyl cis-trans isomerase